MRRLGPSWYRFLGWNTQGDLGPYTLYTDRRQSLVIFLKAPPRTPPSWRQKAQRNRFRQAASLWNALSPDRRKAWQLATDRAHLALTGYDLFIYFTLKNDRPAIQTIERQTHVKLLD